ncbi:MAG: hypothetical protein FJ118_15635 [Deltaproteobacteria bacterium]|nr:hypothetical protein [Deltaproteobacteria bacterium]
MGGAKSKKGRSRGRLTSPAPGHSPSAPSKGPAETNERFRQTVASLTDLPPTFQALRDLFQHFGTVNPFILREETLRRIEHLTHRPLISYVTKVYNVPREVPARIDDSDLSGFLDLTSTVDGDCLDLFLVSNGGSPEATERIVALLRQKFQSLRVIVPGNAFSAATLMCFAADEIIMGPIGTLGPIDPQVNGIPAEAVLKSIETIEQRIKKEGIASLAPYSPLLKKYDLHFLEMCKAARELSRELAEKWLTDYMFKRATDEQDSDCVEVISRIVEEFASYDTNKSHGRGIGREKARAVGLKVVFTEEVNEKLTDLMNSLFFQYEFLFDATNWFKLFENARGISWGKSAQPILVAGGPPPLPPRV